MSHLWPDRAITVVIESLGGPEADYRAGKDAMTFDGAAWVPMETARDRGLRTSIQHDLGPEKVVHFLQAGLESTESITVLVHASASSVGMWTTPRFGSIDFSEGRLNGSPAVNLCGLVSELPERVARVVLAMQVVES